MKRVILAVIAATSLGLIASNAAMATNNPPEDRKVFVCKYVGKPGVDERLKDGKNPISVSSNATVGTWFNDAQGRSYVLAVDDGDPGPQDDPDVSACPAPDNPPDTQVRAAVTFHNATCTTPASYTATPVEGITYSLTGTVGPGNTVTVKATANEGFELVGPDSFEFTFAAAPTNCNPPQEPCPDGGPHDRGKDGQVPGSGNTNDDCDRSVPPVPPMEGISPPPDQGGTTPPVTPVTPTQPTKPVKPTKTVKPNKPKTVPNPPKDVPEQPTEPTVTPQETLPYTGLNGMWFAVAGLGLLGSGLGLRRLGA